MPPNCILEVDDITRSFTYEEKFDLIHIRMLAGSLSTEQWHQLYRRCYDALAPGGWIEHYDVRTLEFLHLPNVQLTSSP